MVPSNYLPAGPRIIADIGVPLATLRDRKIVNFFGSVTELTTKLGLQRNIERFFCCGLVLQRNIERLFCCGLVLRFCDADVNFNF